jgi:hypothetical protein
MKSRVVLAAITMAAGLAVASVGWAQEICGQGNWECRSTVNKREGAAEWGRCPPRGSDNIACYLDVTDVCIEKASGQKFTKQYRQYTGVCVSSFADCW